MDPLLLSQMLDTEQRLNKPLNAACPDEMYESIDTFMDSWCASPQASPTLKFSKLTDEEPSTTSSAGIEIRIQSPSENENRKLKS